MFNKKVPVESNPAGIYRFRGLNWIRYRWDCLTGDWKLVPRRKQIRLTLTAMSLSMFGLGFVITQVNRGWVLFVIVGFFLIWTLAVAFLYHVLEAAWFFEGE